MGLSNYGELQTAVANFIDRTDMSAQIVDAIFMAEAEIARRVRRCSTRTSLTISAAATSVPEQAAEVRSITLVTGSGGRDVPLRLVSPQMLEETKARYAGSTGRPVDFCVIGGNIVVAPTPDGTYTATIVYFDKLSYLTGSTSSDVTNATFDEAPDMYYYGALKHMSLYLEHDARLPQFAAPFDAAIDQMNEMRQREEYGADFKTARLPVVFG